MILESKSEKLIELLKVVALHSSLTPKPISIVLGNTSGNHEVILTSGPAEIVYM